MTNRMYWMLVTAKDYDLSVKMETETYAVITKDNYTEIHVVDDTESEKLMYKVSNIELERDIYSPVSWFSIDNVVRESDIILSDLAEFRY